MPTNLGLLTPAIAQAIQGSSLDQGRLGQAATIRTRSPLGIGLQALSMPPAYGTVYIDSGGSNVTGLRIEAGLYARQALLIVNYGSASLQFDVDARSNLLGSAAVTISFTSGQMFAWLAVPQANSGTGIWVTV